MQQKNKIDVLILVASDVKTIKTCRKITNQCGDK
jgi:hypothetical protein